MAENSHREIEGHRLYPLRSDRTPRRVVFFDTETWIYSQPDGSQRHLYRLGYATYCTLQRDGSLKRQNEVLTYDPLDLCDWIIDYAQPKKPLTAIAHNVWFDFRVSGMLYRLLDRGYRLTRFFVRGKTQILAFKNDERKIRFLSTTNFFPLSVEQLGAEIGLKKRSVDYFRATDRELEKYVRRDVEIIECAFSALCELSHREKLGGVGLTIASTALRCYRRRYLRDSIYIHRHKRAQRLEMDAYFGGRNECFYVGHAPRQTYWKLDVNSMYPYVMYTGLYPTRLVGYAENIDVETLRFWLRRYALIAECEVNLQKPWAPYRMGEHVVYPVGRFVTFLCTRGIRRAIREGSLLQASRVTIYDRGPIFRDYVRELYRLRQKLEHSGRSGYGLCVKLLMNSLYGKFAQYRDRVVEEWDAPDYEAYVVEAYNRSDGKWYVYEVFGGRGRCLELRTGPAINALFAIAAHITEDARLYLADLIDTAGKGNVYYIDTDSLIVTEEGYNALSKMVAPEALGALKVEGVSTHLVIYACKDYEFGSEKRIKGVRDDAIEIATGVYTQFEFPTARTELRHIMPDHYIVRRVTKHLRREYKKGHIGPDGWVTPIRL